MTDTTTEFLFGNDTAACENFPMVTYIHYSVPIAVTLFLILCFLTTRTNRGCRNCCWGRPAFVIPVNMLDSFKHRWAFACAYGSISNIIVSFFFDSREFFPTDDRWLRVLATFAGAFEVCIVFSPFFGCLNTDSTIIAPLIGFAYSGAWFGLFLYSVIYCPDPYPESIPMFNVISTLPTLLCCFFLVVNFLRLAVLGIYNRCKKVVPPPVQIASDRHNRHIVALLTKPTEKEKKTRKDMKCYKYVGYLCKNLLLDKVMLNKTYFLFSTRIICTMVVAALSLFQLFLEIYGFRNDIVGFIDFIARPFLEMPRLVPAADALFHLVMWIVIIIMAIQFGLSLYKYRVHTLMMYRGDKSFFPQGYDQSNTNIMRTSMMFPGYQMAYTIWGYVLLSLILMVGVIVVCVLFIIPAIDGDWAFIWSWAQIIVTALVTTITLRIIQVLLATFVFLQDKVEKEDKDRPLAITNRRAYHFTIYFFFIANVAIGLISCLLRILFGLLGGLFMLARLDHPVVMKGLEQMDAGHMAYLAVLSVEHAHNHPVLRVFCDLLLSGAGQAVTSDTGGNMSVNSSQIMPETLSVTSLKDGLEKDGASRAVVQTRQQLARNRWHLLYTLLKNPNLMQHRVHENSQHEDRLLLYTVKKELLGRLDPQNEKPEIPSKANSLELHELDDLLEEHVDEIKRSLNAKRKLSDNKEDGMKDSMVVKVLQDDTQMQDNVYKNTSLV